jgi:hypothetical protein
LMILNRRLHVTVRRNDVCIVGNQLAFEVLIFPLLRTITNSELILAAELCVTAAPY